MSDGLKRPVFRRRGFGAALAGLVAAVAFQAAGTAHAQTDPVAEFYKGKTVTILVGYEGGGGYDLYARIVAQSLGKHIPGNPAVIVQNMPGAGGLRAARSLMTASPKDGTVVGMLAQTLPFDTLLGYTPDVDAARFIWIGRVAMNVEVGVAIAKTGVTSIDDARKREVPTAGTGGTASSTVVPFLLNQLAGTRFKLIAGYKSANEALVTMERGEVDAVGAIGLSTIMARHAPRVKDGTFRLIYQNALTRHPDIPDVPTIGELGNGKDERVILDLFASGAAIGRALIAPPDVPPERVAALRRALAATLADPEMIAFSKKGNLPLEPGTGEELEAIVRQVLSIPKPIADKTREVMESLKTPR
jgi:tripartite-type tricarboxylate transporter receptor subunit TctC